MATRRAPDSRSQSARSRAESCRSSQGLRLLPYVRQREMLVGRLAGSCLVTESVRLRGRARFPVEHQYLLRCRARASLRVPAWCVPAWCVPAWCVPAWCVPAWCVPAWCGCASRVRVPPLTRARVRVRARRRALRAPRRGWRPWSRARPPTLRRRRGSARRVATSLASGRRGPRRRW